MYLCKMINTFHKNHHKKPIEILLSLIESALSMVKLTAKSKVELLNIVNKKYRQPAKAFVWQTKEV